MENRAIENNVVAGMCASFICDGLHYCIKISLSENLFFWEIFVNLR